jgi:iron complex transport system ATP-binding protein
VVNALELDHVSVAIDGRSIVDDVSLHVGRGEWLTLLGPNGAGKTTLLRVVAGTRAYSGRAIVDGEEVSRHPRRAAARKVALVPQVPIVPPAMSVADYVLLGRTPHLGVFTRAGAEDHAAAAAAVVRLDLADVAGRPLGSLSGGELQRAVLARALAQQAPVLLLDEPTTALDIGHQQQVLELVDELRRESGLTVLAALHDLTLASQYGDAVALVDAGRVVARGAAAEVLTPARVEGLFKASVRLLDADGSLAVVPVRPS